MSVWTCWRWKLCSKAELTVGSKMFTERSRVTCVVWCVDEHLSEFTTDEREDAVVKHVTPKGKLMQSHIINSLVRQNIWQMHVRTCMLCHVLRVCLCTHVMHALLNLYERRKKIKKNGNRTNSTLYSIGFGEILRGKTLWNKWFLFLPRENQGKPLKTLFL